MVYLLTLSLILGLEWAHATERFECAGHAVARAPSGVAAKLVTTSSPQKAMALVIFARFQDEEDTPIPPYSSNIFDPDQPGSLSHFYDTMSFGQLQLDGVILPDRYASERRAASYLAANPGKSGGYSRFVLDILKQVDEQVDFALFDNDGPDGMPDSGDDDGIVDYIFVNMLSTPPGFIVGGATGIAGLGFSKFHSTGDRGQDGRPIRIGSWIWQGSVVQEGTFAQTVGSMAHEFAHNLGLPDLYDQQYGSPQEDSAGIGFWGLMGWGAHGWNGDDGPNPLSAWSLEQLGWVGPDNSRLVDLSVDVDGLVVGDLQRGGSIYKVPLRAEHTSDNIFQEEYLLLEHRTRSGSYYDRSLPGEGVLIWHIRPHFWTNGDEHGKLVDLVCADGLYQDAGHPSGRRADGRLGQDNLDYWAHNRSYAMVHNGNLGDASDPFDGRQFTSFDSRSNPSTNPQALNSVASSGPSFTFTRRGQDMVVDFRQPRWSGILREQVHWSRTVQVDGDLQVAPNAMLQIHDDTQVIFAGTDRLVSGRDPKRVELDIRGDLLLLRRSNKQRMVFRASNPEEDWYGILLNQAPTSVIRMEENDYELKNARHGFVFGDISTGTAKLGLHREFRLEDEPGGNGDGQLGPGESFQLNIAIDNWSLKKITNLEVSYRWEPSALVEPWLKVGSEGESGLLQRGSMYPGGHLEIAPPIMRVSPDARAGQEVTFVTSVRTRARAYSDTLVFRIAGSYPDHEAELEVPGHRMHNQSVHISSMQPTPLRAAVSGAVEAADLVVYSLPLRERVAVVPMTPALIGDRYQVFETTFRPTAPGAYQAFLRVRSPQGAVVFSDEALYLWVTGSDNLPTVLVFLGDHYNASQKAALKRVAAAAIEALGLRALFVDWTQEEGSVYRSLLPHFAGDDGLLVIWMGRRLDAEGQTAFTDFLENGGRLLLVSRQLDNSRNISSFLGEALHVRQVGREIQESVEGRYLGAPFKFEVDHDWLLAKDPETGVLHNSRGRAAGVQVDAGTYRVAYLPFDLKDIDDNLKRILIDANLFFLHEPATSTAELEIVADERLGDVPVALTGRASLVRASADGSANKTDRAELIVRVGPELRLVEEIPMRPSVEEGGAVFEAWFEPPDQGRYQLFVRWRDAEGNAVLGSTSQPVVSFAADRDALILFADDYTDQERVRLTWMLSAALAELDIEATVVDLVGDDAGAYESLVNQYMGEGKLLMWLDDFKTASARNVMRRFLLGGGRLLTASMTTSEEESAFLQKWLFADMVAISRTTSESLVHPHVKISSKQRFYEIAPPALPVLMNKRGLVSGLQLDTGVYRAVHLGFDFQQDVWSRLQPLLTETLPFLYRGSDYEASLEVAGKQAAETMSLEQLGEPVPIRADVLGPARAATLIVRSRPPMRFETEVPMALTTVDGERRIFETTFVPNRAGQYQFFLRLEGEDGKHSLEGNPLQVATTPFDEWHPVLLIMDDKTYGPTAIEALAGDLEAVLQQSGLRANVLEREPDNEQFYEALLSRYLGGRGLVVWMGRTMNPETREALQSFLERGGRLLVASSGLTFSADIDSFLREIFHIRRIYDSVAGEDLRFAGGEGSVPLAGIRYSPLQLRGAAAPMLQDESGRVAAHKLDTGIYRAVYLSLDMRLLESPARREVFGHSIPFLLAEKVRIPQLIVRSEMMPTSPVDLEEEPLTLQATVTNAGSEISSTFHVGYQILKDERVVARAWLRQAPLEPGAERTISLPSWRGAREGRFAVRFVMSGTDEGLVYLPTEPLELVSVQASLEEMELDGDMSAGNGAGFFDADGDGDLDLYIVRLHAPNQLWRNHGTEFEEVAAAVGVDDGGPSRGIGLGDYDGDGHLDLYLVSEGANRFLRSRGDGGFDDVTDRLGDSAAGTRLGDAGSGRSAAFLDHDGDGDLDLYLVNANGPNRFFRNDDGLFDERAGALGLTDEGNGRGLAVADYDGDGDVDLFVANQPETWAAAKAEPSRLYLNEAGVFRDGNEDLGLALPGNEVSAVFGDYDGDGDADLFVASQQDDNQLWQNEGGSGLQRLTGQDLGSRIVGAAFFDYDNDGDLDLATTAVNPSFGGDQLYQNIGGELVAVGALLDMQSESDGRGITYADWDRDGDLDLFVADYHRSRLYRNDSNKSSAHWLQLSLRSPGLNSHALGARVRVVADGRSQYRELQSSLGYGSQVSPQVHFGLGASERIDTLEVRWPDGRVSVQKGVAADQHLMLAHPAGLISARAVAETGRPAVFSVSANFPNPFNAQTTISYHLPQPAAVDLAIYNGIGQLVRRLVREPQAEGQYEVVWNGRDDEGRPVGNGVYLYRLVAGTHEQTRRLVLLK